MPYDEELDDRIAAVLLPIGAERKKMFGGTGYMVGGNLTAGVHKDALILRLDDEAASDLLQMPFVRPFDITGRPMRGWVMVNPGAVTDEHLSDWLSLALRHAESLPKK